MTQPQVDVPALISDVMSFEEMQVILRLAALKEEKGEEFKAAREAFIAALPVATSEQVKALVALARVEAEYPEGIKPNQDLRLTSEQQDQINAAKEERADELTAKKAEILDELKGDGSRFVSFKVRATAKQTTKTLRFVKKHGSTGGGSGLVDQLRRELA
ncbi:MAG: hypothetical protein R3F07_03960 [Opitutaceae bacterium]